jgi:catechol 2,3-dioxygenase-like lactoylglutathione lyase family enzyme
MGLSDYKVGAVIAVSGMARARDFYEGKLGLSPGANGSEHMQTYECADGTGLLVYLSPDHAGKSTATLAGWAVDDVEELVDELSARGVVFEQYDQPGIKTNEKGIVEDGRFKAAWVRDPDGNTLAINQEV